MNIGSKRSVTSAVPRRWRQDVLAGGRSCSVLVRVLGTRSWYAFLVRYAEIPHHFQLAFQGSQYTIGGAFLTIFTSMFIHGGFMHILGNMWFLWVFGRGVEDLIGHGWYLAFYLVCGAIAGLIQMMVNPSSPIQAKSKVRTQLRAGLPP